MIDTHIYKNFIDINKLTNNIYIFFVDILHKCRLYDTYVYKERDEL